MTKPKQRANLSPTPNVKPIRPKVILARDNPTNQMLFNESRMDGWSNILTNLGVKGKDKRTFAEVGWDRSDETSLDDLFAGDKIARKVASKPAQECMQKGWLLKGLPQDRIDKILEREQELGLRSHDEQAWITARTHGGAGVLLLNGDLDLQKPMSRVGKILSFVTLSRWELQINFSDLQTDPFKPRYQLPEYYTLYPRSGNSGRSGTRIHWTRIIRWDGEWLPPRLFQQNGYWHDSVLNSSIADSIRDYQTSNDSLASMVQDMSVAVFKLKNLAEQVASDGDKEVIKRMQIADLGRSILRAIVIDADMEEFTHETRTVTGVGETMDQIKERLVAETEFPHTILFGNSPSGMGGTGNHEMKYWYDFLEAQQTNYLKPRLIQGYNWIMDDLGFTSEEKKKLEIHFFPLERMDDSTQADANLKQAQADDLYIGNGVLQPEEVRTERFSGDEVSFTTKVQTEDPAGAPVPELVVDPAAPAPAPAPSAAKPADVASQAMNGAQVTSLLEILAKVGESTLPKASAKVALKAAFPLLTVEQINGMVDPIKEGSIPSPEANPNPSPVTP